MNSEVKRVYRCYLGKSLGHRTYNIIDGIKKDNIKDFFKKYSTTVDTISDFIRRGEKLGLSDFFKEERQ